MPQEQPQPTSAGESARSRALEKLLDISKRLGESSDLSVVLGVIIDAMRDLLAAERATVFTYEPATNELAIHIAHGVAAAVDQGVIRFPATVGVAGACATTRLLLNIPDAYADARFNPEVDRQTGFCTTSILAIPLIDHAGELVGVAQVLNAARGLFSVDDEQLATGVAAHAAIALRRARLIQDHVDKLKLQEEMNVAREIQEKCFPSRLPVHPAYDIAAHSTPADECGGDAFDCFGVRGKTIAQSDEAPEHIYFLLADATGHGVGPALSSMQARSMMRIAARLGQPLGPLAREMNEQLLQDVPLGRFVTAWLGALDLAMHSIECFSAGQGPVFIYRRSDDRFEEIGSDAPPFGIISGGFNWDKTSHIQLECGDMLVLLTDGYYEAVSPSGVLWNELEVCEIIRAMRDEPMSAIRQELDRAVLQFACASNTDDDRTAILVKRII
ncbi:MAG: GAF domain-containing protein [Phycisphaerales bacterium]|nr:GAF domain-containing protein [Phycisphaerales bacterium]